MDITFTTLPSGNVRLEWTGIAGAGPKGQASAGRCCAEFDGCPVRKLTPMESAQEWATRVLGLTPSKNGE